MGLNGTKPDGSRGAAGRPVPCRAFAVLGPGGARWHKAFPATTLRPEGHSKVSETLLDSLDRRLGRAGIELATNGASPRVACRLAPFPAERNDDSQGALACTLVLEHPPRFAWDFPPAQALPLARILEARAVGPIGVHEKSLARWAVLDDQGKVVAWIDEERHRFLPAGRGAPRAVSAHRLLLRGLRGYDLDFERVARVLAGTSGLAPTEVAFDARAQLASAARRPGRWPVLVPGVRAGVGLARIARSQLQVLAANAPGLRADHDAEYLHDSRIALRRLRSLLGQLGGVLDAQTGAYLVDELRWLAGCTGPARDLDTLLFELRLTEPELRAELAPVLSALEEERARQQERLVAELDSARCAELMTRLRAAFSTQGMRAHAGPRAAKSFASLLAKRLRRRLRDVLTRAEHLGAGSPCAELHELRIACKKLRYLLECCRGLAPKAELQTCFAHLKGLQAILGTIQDAEVQAKLAHELVLLGAQAGAGAHVALGRFLERSAQRGRSARAQYAERASALLLPASRAQFATLLGGVAREQ